MLGWHAGGSWLQVSFLVRSKIFLVEVVANLSLHSKQLELGQDVLRYPDLQGIGNGIWSGPPDTAKNLILKDFKLFQATKLF